MRTGGVATLGGHVKLHVVKAGQLPKLWERFLPSRRISMVEQELKRLRTVWDAITRRDQMLEEIAALEESLHTPTDLTGREPDRVLRQYLRVMGSRMLGKVAGVAVFDSRLRMLHLPMLGVPVDYGLVSLKVITNAGVAFLVDAWQNLVELEIMKFHGIGTGGTAEAATETALVTELTTQYNPDNTRATGSLTENAANVFRTVGTNTVDAAVSITEHGILSQAATGGGTLWDRSLFTAIALANGDSLQSTYDMTATAGG